MKRTGADFHVIGLQDDAALARPVALQCQDNVLKARRVRRRRGASHWLRRFPEAFVRRNIVTPPRPVKKRTQESLDVTTVTAASLPTTNLPTPVHAATKPRRGVQGEVK